MDVVFRNKIKWMLIGREQYVLFSKHLLKWQPRVETCRFSPVACYSGMLSSVVEWVTVHRFILPSCIIRNLSESIGKCRQILENAKPQLCGRPPLS